MTRLERMQQRLGKMNLRLERIEQERTLLRAGIADLKSRRDKRLLQHDKAVKLLTAGLLFEEAGILEDYNREAVLEILKSTKGENQ